MIVCVGTTPVYQRSMIFERVRPNDVNRAAAVHDYASGKAVNVARVLHTLGEAVGHVGFVHRGADRGTGFLSSLAAARIPDYSVPVDGVMRQCITVIDRAAGTATELVEEARPIDAVDWRRMEARLAETLRGATGCVLSGSLPPGGPQDFYRSCLGQLPAQVPVVLDARGEPLRLALAHRAPFVVKLNRDELAATVGAPAGTDEELRLAMREVLPPGGAVVVTLGAGGAVALDAEQAWRIHAPRVTARSAVGSGDAFAAGLIMQLVRRRPLKEACATGAACGAANAMTDLAGHLSPADVEALRGQARIEPF